MSGDEISNIWGVIGGFIIAIIGKNLNYKNENSIMFNNPRLLVQHKHCCTEAECGEFHR